MHSKYDFEFINDQLLSFGAVHSAAELHGMLSGLISAGGSPHQGEWLGTARHFLDLEDSELTTHQQTLFEDLLRSTLNHFHDDFFQFFPLLPSDDTQLSQRASELAAWCSGFLHGLGRVLGENKEQVLAHDVAEAMRDIANISQVHVDQEDGTAENEGYWCELVEYVKVAVLTIYNEYQSNQGESIVH